MTGEELYQQALAGQQSLAVAFLSQCETAREAAEPAALRSATAQLSRHLPVVIGMQWSIGARAAQVLAAMFYGELAEEPQAADQEDLRGGQAEPPRLRGR